MTDSSVTREQNEIIIRIIVIVAIILTFVGAVYWVLSSQVGIQGIDIRQGCNTIAFVLGGFMSKLDCIFTNVIHLT
jgi:flagellar basal body-associated protein FliL